MNPKLIIYLGPFECQSQHPVSLSLLRPARRCGQRGGQPTSP